MTGTVQENNDKQSVEDGIARVYPNVSGLSR